MDEKLMKWMKDNEDDIKWDKKDRGTIDMSQLSSDEVKAYDEYRFRLRQERAEAVIDKYNALYLVTDAEQRLVREKNNERYNRLRKPRRLKK